MIAKRILFRCDGSPQIGFGHVVRCLALADELQDKHGCKIAFAMLGGLLGVAQVRKHGYLVYQPNLEITKPVNEGDWLQSLVRELGAQVLVLDVRTELPIEAIKQIRQSGVLIATIDDPSERRLETDLAFYPPVPQVEFLDWSGFRGTRHVGWEWVLLRSEFYHYRQKLLKIEYLQKSFAGKPTVLITMGGSDPAGLTLKVLQSIDLLDEEFNTVAILGSGFQEHVATKLWAETAKRKYNFLINVEDMPSVMTRSDMAIVSFGVTAYELATLGVPSIHLCLSDDHAISSSAFDRAGMAKSLGYHADVSSHMIAASVQELLLDHQERHRIQKRCFAQPIGGGCRLIASAIKKSVNHSCPIKSLKS
jgi:spore coat polysaccharide biosynthesis protein SpsF